MKSYKTQDKKTVRTLDGRYEVFRIVVMKGAGEHKVTYSREQLDFTKETLHCEVHETLVSLLDYISFLNIGYDMLAIRGGLILLKLKSSDKKDLIDSTFNLLISALSRYHIKVDEVDHVLINKEKEFPKRTIQETADGITFTKEENVSQAPVEKKEEEKKSLKVRTSSQVVMIGGKRMTVSVADLPDLKVAVVYFQEQQTYTALDLVDEALSTQSGVIKFIGNGRVCNIKYSNERIISGSLADGFDVKLVTLTGSIRLVEHVKTYMVKPIAPTIYEKMRLTLFGV